MFKRDVSLIFGFNWGRGLNSEAWLGSLFPVRALGQAGVCLYANASTGNLFVEGPQRRWIDRGFDLAIGLVYNSQAVGKPWRLSQGRKLGALRGTVNTAGSAITLNYEDGGQSTFSFDATAKTYVAHGLSTGQETLAFDAAAKCWTWSAVGTGRVEHYDSQSKLQQDRVDAAGRTLTYHYDTRGRLTRLSAPSGQAIVWEYRTTTLAIYCQSQAGVKTLWQKHELDAQGRIMTTHIVLDEKTRYDIHYQYDQKSGALSQLTQADGTQLHCAYGGDAQRPVLSGWQDGEARQTMLALDTAKRMATLTTPLGADFSESYTWDAGGHLVTWDRPTAAGDKERFSYTWTPTGQLHECRYPCGAVEARTYDALGLLTQTKDALQHPKDFYRDKKSGVCFSRVRTITVAGKAQPLAVWDVVNTQRQLRYRVNATGSVTRFDYDAQGNCITQRTHLTKTLDVSHQSASAAILQSTCDTWWTSQPQDQVARVDFARNALGQVIEERHFAACDKTGKGIADDTMSLVKTTWTVSGQWLQRDTQRSKTQTVTESQTFDGLDRCLTSTDGNKNKTFMTFSGQTHSVQTPLGLQTITTWDRSGLVTMECTQDVNLKTPIRKTTYKRDAAGRLFKTIHPDQTTTVSLYDPRGRLMYSVDADQYVTAQAYDDWDHETTVTHFAERLTVPMISKLSSQDAQALCETLISVVGKDRTTTTLTDWGGRLRYTIDGEGYVVERQYDAADRLTQTIRYSTALAAGTPRLLSPDGETLKGIVADPTYDRRQAYYYDAANHRIGAWELAGLKNLGYVVEHALDAAGRPVRTIRYAQAVAYAPTWSAVRPSPSPYDAIHQTYRDGRGQVVREVDAEQYVTTHRYTADGLVDATERYANALPHDHAQNLPPVSSEDRTATFSYDGCDRVLVETEQPVGRQTERRYDAAGHVIFKRVKDLQQPSEHRSEYARFDAYGAVTAKIDARGGAVIAAIDADKKLTPAQKDAKIAQFWQDHATRYRLDATGLNITTYDPLGNRTLHYYDRRRNLAVTIDPTGAVVALQHDAFLDVVTTQRYAKRVDAKTLPTLKGGVMDDALKGLLAHLADPTHDALRYSRFDRRGKQTVVIDAEQFETHTQVNAFGETLELQEQITQATKGTPATWRTTQHTYTHRGLRAATTVDPDGLKLTRSWTYTFQSVEATEKNALGAVTTLGYDRLARKVTQTDALKHTSRWQWDSFARLVSTTDRTEYKTSHRYDRAKRTHTVKYATNRERTETSDVYGAVTKVELGTGAVTITTYEPGGQIESVTDPLERVTRNDTNLAGWRDAHTAPNLTMTTYQFDAVGHVTGHIEDPKGVAITTVLTLDAQGLEIGRVNPINVHDDTQRNRRGEVIAQRVYNPLGEDRVTTTQRNGLGLALAVSVGSPKQAAQRITHYSYDTAGRPRATVKDPAGLKVTSTTHRNAQGAVILTIDPRGGKTRTVRDELNRAAYTIMPNGAVVRHYFDGEGHIVKQVAYATCLDPKTLSDQTTVAALDQQMATTTSADDRVTYYRYDGEGREVYRIHPDGAVTETCYDQAAQVVKTVRYAHPIDPRALHGVQPSEVTKLLKPDSKADRVVHQVRDLAGQVVFHVDALGRVQRSRYDANGHRSVQHAYRNPINVSTLPAWTADAVSAAVQQDVQDRVQASVYDAVDRLVYQVNGVGAVIEKRYDAVHQCKTEIHYANPLAKWPLTLEAIQKAVVPNPDADRTTGYQYDALRHRINRTNALRQEESWRYNALGECTQHKDRCGNVWENRYDALGRQTDQLTPLVTVQDVAPDKTHAGHLVAGGAVKARLWTKRTLDANGNTVGLAKGYEDPTKKILIVASHVSFTYDALNHMTKTTQAGVPVDDLSKALMKPGDRPESLQTLSETRTLNAFGQVLVEVDQAGAPHFNVFDGQGRVAYRVTATGSVTAYNRNAFGDTIKLVQFASPLGLKLSDYAQQGLTVALVQAHMTPSPTADRTAQLTYDQAGQKRSVRQAQVWVYTIDPEGVAQMGRGMPEHRFEYNAFGEVTLEGELVDAKASQLAVKRHYFNQAGWRVADVDPNGYFTTLGYNAFGQVTEKHSYAQAVDPRVLGERLPSRLVAAEKDIVTRHVYDVLGRPTRNILCDVSSQRVTLDAQHIPQLSDNPLQDAVTKTTYTATDQAMAVVGPQGETVMRHYDAAGREIFRQQPQRETFDKAAKTVEQKTFALDALGHVVMETRHAQALGKIRTATNVPPLPADQITLKTYDVRGKCLKTQAPDGAVTETSYGLTGQPARTFQWVTGWLSGKVVQRLREQKITRDPTDRPTQLSTRALQTGQALNHQLRYNPFGEVDAEDVGDSKAPWPIHHAYDQVGRRWKSNAGGIETLTLFDGRALDTGTVRSASQDLSGVTEDNLGRISLAPEVTQVVRIQRDLAGHITQQQLPPFRHLKPGTPEPLRTTLSAGPHHPEFAPFSLSWPAPKEEFLLKGKLGLSQNLKASKVTDYTWYDPIEAKSAEGEVRWGIDTTKLPGDRYAFRLEYHYKDPQTGKWNFNARQATWGQVTLDTGTTVGSKNVGSKMLDEDTLLITGKTDGIVGVALTHDGQVIEKLGMTSAGVTGRFILDASDVLSGRYTPKLITHAFAQGGLLTLNSTDPHGRRVELHKTLVNRVSGQPYAISWQDLAPGILKVEGDMGFAMPNGTLVWTGYKWGHTNPVAPTASGQIVYTASQMPRNALPAVNRLYGYDQLDVKKTKILGVAWNPDLPHKTGQPPYVYYKPAVGDPLPTRLVAFDTKGDVKATLGLKPWMSGWYRGDAHYLNLKSATQYRYQAYSLGEPDPARAALEIVDILTAQRPTTLQARTFSIPDFALFGKYSRHGGLVSRTNFTWTAPKDFAHAPFQINYTTTSQNTPVSTYVGVSYDADYYPGDGPYNHAAIDWSLYDGVWTPIYNGHPDRRRVSATANHFFCPIKQLVVHPLPAAFDPGHSQLDYLDDDGDIRVIIWRKLDMHAVPKKPQPGRSKTLTADIASLEPSHYQFRLKLKDASGQVLPIPALPEGFWVDAEGYIRGEFRLTTYYGDDVTTTIHDQYEWVYPKRWQLVDHQGKTIQHIDPSGAVTRYLHNKRGQLAVQEDPSVSWFDEHGQQHNGSPVTKYGIDLSGHLVAKVAPNGAVTAHWRNSLGEGIHSVDPSGVWQTNVRDAFGRVWAEQNVRGIALTTTYDQANRIVSETNAALETTRFSYNERGKQLTRINANKETTRFDYDESDRVVMTELPEGQTTTRQYHFPSGQLIVEDMNDGHPLHWERDVFGLARQHTDKGGAVVAYQRNYTGQVKKLTTTKEGAHGVQYTNAGHTEKVNVPGQLLRYFFDEGGRHIWVFDDNTHTKTEYYIDIGGRRIGERFVGTDGYVWQHTRIGLDALKRITQVEDIRMEAKYQFDQNSNRRRTQVWYKQLSADMDPAKTKKHDIKSANHWFAYDRADRIKVDRGILDAKTKTITIAPGQGTQLSYNSTGWRIAETIQQKSGKTIRRDIDYYPQGRVKSLNNHVDETDAYTYDKAGRRTDYAITDSHGKKTIHYTRYNPNGWVIEQGQKEQPLSVSPVLLVQTQFTDFYPDGQARKQDTYQYNPKKSGQKTLHDDMNLSYVGFDSWHLVQNAGRRYRYDSKKWTDRNAVTVTFDANGYPQSIDGDLQGQEGFRWFQVNPEGRIVLKENDKGQELYIYGPQGQVIGWVGDLQTDPTSIDVPSKVNFDPTFHVVTRNWPPAMPGQYVAQAGDTFNSISRLLYGDPSFAYLIAQANGYSPGDNAPVGAVLKVPQVTLTGEHNRAGQFAPYNPGALIGSLYPDMPIPPPPPRHFLAMLLEIIASAVITILLSPTGGGAAAGAVWLVTILEDAAIYAGISGLSDVVTQMIGMAFGSQEKFSWHEFGNALETGAISGALGGGLAQLGRLHLKGLSFIGKGLKQGKGADVNWTEVGAKLFDNEVLTISGELASMALGQQKRFSWLDVFNSALQTGAGEALAKEGLGDDDKGFKGFVSDVASSEIDAAISAEIYHDRFNPALAFAHAIGTYAGEHLKQAWHQHLYEQAQKEEKAQERWMWNFMMDAMDEYLNTPPEDVTSNYFAKHTGPRGHERDHLDTPTLPDDGTFPWSNNNKSRSNTMCLWHPGSTGHKEGISESQQLKDWTHQDAQADAQARAAFKHYIAHYLAQLNSNKALQAAVCLVWATTELGDNLGATLDNVYLAAKPHTLLGHVVAYSLGLSDDAVFAYNHPKATTIGFFKQAANVGLDIWDVLTGPSGLQPQLKIRPNQRVGAGLANAASYFIPVPVKGFKVFSIADKQSVEVAESLKAEMKIAVQKPLKDLSGKSLHQVKSSLKQAGYKSKSSIPTKGRWQTYFNHNGSKVDIHLPSGRVVRTERPIYDSTGRRINKGQRLNAKGERIPRNLPHNLHPKETFNPDAGSNPYLLFGLVPLTILLSGDVPNKNRINKIHRR